MESKEWIEADKAWKINVVFYYHDITRFVIGIDAAAGIGHHQNADAQALEYANWKSNLQKQTKTVNDRVVNLAPG
jgi:hypothetical protein